MIMNEISICGNDQMISVIQKLKEPGDNKLNHGVLKTISTGHNRPFYISEYCNLEYFGGCSSLGCHSNVP